MLLLGLVIHKAGKGDKVSLYFISTLNENNEYGSRCVGFTVFRKSAEDIIENSINDIHEQTYKYAVIEEIEREGLYPDVRLEEWFCWSDKENKYIPIEKPEQFKHLCNFAIG